ncbi:cyclohexanecarboxylate-CoA ligase [Oceanobacillus piezotolerans]|uniref:Cyclohexanecarboxylate-CoA ligase n=1 Tax=Oceanobacillus piezotolerans TaxID=2448030 RepID=A0A498D8L2_9BACI|nr:AMP-binding protein [Oceanobacillus piezotolerans]RLL46886.1 cyclohexanecarboxylate-CoA ligase [Oceanobacillus piezotolerans]
MGKFETLLTDTYIEKYQSLWPNKTILDYLNEAIEKYPDNTAIVDVKSRYTYRELGKIVDRVAIGLKEFGLEKEDVISLQLPNWNEFIILHLAATRIGAITNPLVPIFRDREINYMLSMTEAKMLVIPDTFRNFNYPEMVNRLINGWPAMEKVFVIGENVPEEMESLSVLFDEPWEKIRDIAELDNITHDPNEVTEIIFTSGTTGDPKGVMHTHNTLCVSTNYWIDRLHLTSEDVMFMASTFAHQAGFGYGVRLPIHIAGTGVYQDIWNPQEFIQLIKKENITFTAGATPFLQDTVQLDGIENQPIDKLRAFVTIGAPIPRPLVKEAKSKVNFTILAGWGQSENGLVTLTSLNDSEEKLTGTDGFAFPGMEVMVVDDNFRECRPNEEGSLLSKGPAQFVGYLKRMDITEAEHHDGWFITGDRAVMDEDGYIRISGRDKDIIIRGGENIPVAYIENVLYEHPDISVAQVVAMPDTRLQERACAFISLKSGKEAMTLEELKNYLQEKGVAKQYWPEHLEVVEDFPRTPSGKIQKFRLREQIRQQLNQVD